MMTDDRKKREGHEEEGTYEREKDRPGEIRKDKTEGRME